MVKLHRRIQDFVGGGGGQGPLGPHGSAPDYCAAVNCLGGGEFFCGEGGGPRPPCPPPLDPRLSCERFCVAV